MRVATNATTITPTAVKVPATFAFESKNEFFCEGGAELEDEAVAIWVIYFVDTSWLDDPSTVWMEITVVAYTDVVMDGPELDDRVREGRLEELLEFDGSEFSEEPLEEEEEEEDCREDRDDRSSEDCEEDSDEDREDDVLTGPRNIYPYTPSPPHFSL